MYLFCWIPMDCVVTWQLLHKQVRVNHTWEVNFSRACCNWDDVLIYRIPGIKGRRFADELIGDVRPFTVRFADLNHDEIADLAGVSERASNQRRAIELACERLQREGVDYRTDELIATLKELAAGDNGNKAIEEAQKQEGTQEELLGSDE